MRTKRLRAVGVAVLLLLLTVAGARYLSPLTHLPGSIRSMLSITRDILAQTRVMQGEVERVHSGLSRIQQQEALLDEQIRLLAQVQDELAAQERLANTSRGLLGDILQSEQRTVELTAEADRRGAATRSVLAANGSRLDRIAAGAASIMQNSRTVSGQVDSLIGHMEDVQDDLAPVGRVKRAAADVLDRASNWLESLVNFFHG